MEQDALKNEVDQRLTVAEIATYKNKYGKIYQIELTVQPDDFTTMEFEYIFKKPNVASFDRYVKTVSQSSMKAMKTFVNDNIIAEQAQKLAADLEEYPALTLSVGEKLLNMLGLSKEVNLKQL